MYRNQQTFIVLMRTVIVADLVRYAHGMHAGIQVSATDRMQQLEAENLQLRQAASKRSQALAQARHFIDNNLQRSSSMSRNSADSPDNQENGVHASPAPMGHSADSSVQD